MTEENERAREQLEKPMRSAEALHAALGERLVAVVLFGSRARGEADEESDWETRKSSTIHRDMHPNGLAEPHG